MNHGRKRLITLLSGTAVLATGVVVAQPAMAEPDIDDVQTRVDRLYREAEQASERYNTLQIRLEDLRKDLRTLRADQRRQTAKVRAAQAQVEDSIIAQYRGENVATLGEVVVADDPSEFLGDLDAMSSVTDIQAEQYSDFSSQRDALAIRTRATDRRVADLAEAESEARKEKETISTKLDEAQDLLSDLEAEERARLEAAQREETVSRSAPAAPAEPEPAPAASGGAAAAVQYAIAQVGDTYVYGAAGPSSFDCSGLTMMAWQAGGVSLPHSSSAQMGSGTPVSRDDLQPGDLVFYYSPVSHVGIYIGNGQIVHAANPSTDVAYAPVFSMPYSGAVRPG